MISRYTTLKSQTRLGQLSGSATLFIANDFDH